MKKSTFFFTVFWVALIVWCSHALHYWGYDERTSWTKVLLMVLPVAGIASLMAGIIFKSFTEDSPA